MSARKIGTVLDELDDDRTVYRSSASDVFVVSRDEGRFGKPTFYAVLAHNRRIIAKSYGNPGPTIRRADGQQVASLRFAILAYRMQLSAALERAGRHEE